MWRWGNSTLVILGILLAIFFFQNDALHNFLIGIGSWGYLGAFLAGIMFVWTFTAATGAVILLILAESLSPVEIGLIAGLGAMVGDLTILNIFQDNLSKEVKSVYKSLDHDHHLRKLFHSKYFSWSLPVIGAIIIASPLPDELGVSLIGISKMDKTQFAIMSFLLNAAGIFLVISASVIIKP